MKFGKVISSFRQKFGVEQKEFAESVNISVNYLSLLENDKRKPSVTVLKSMAQYFGIPVSVLLFEGIRGMGISPKKADRKTFEAAQPVIDLLLTYLTDGKIAKRTETKQSTGKKRPSK